MTPRPGNPDDPVIEVRTVGSKRFLVVDQEPIVRARSPHPQKIRFNLAGTGFVFPANSTVTFQPLGTSPKLGDVSCQGGNSPQGVPVLTCTFTANAAGTYKYTIAVADRSTGDRVVLDPIMVVD